MVAVADLVKASDEDLEALYPDRSTTDSAAALLALGPAAVVVTRGGDGALWLDREGPVEVASRPVTVADTIGAGDTFGAGLIDALWERGRLGAEHREALGRSTAAEVVEVLEHAAKAAAVTVSRPGADPPWRHELQLTGTVLGRRRQERVHQRYDGRALAAGRGDPLHRPGADVAGGEDARHRGRQVGRRQPVDPRSRGTSRPVSTKLFLSRASSGGIQSQRGSAPSSRNSPRASLVVRSPVLVSSRHSHSSCALATAVDDPGAGQHLDPLVVGDLVDEVLRHRLLEPRAPDHDRHRAREPAQVQRGLAGRVAAADHDDVVPLHLAAPRSSRRRS